MQSECVSISDAIIDGCGGALFQPPCPQEDPPICVMEGNLTVGSDPLWETGDHVTVQGSCYLSGCGNEGNHQFFTNGTGDISLEAANSDLENRKGLDINLRGGNGTSSIGGWGGDIHITGGTGNGGMF